MGYIYLITNTITKKQYVGQTICLDINSRWNQHKRKDNKTIGKYLLNAYEKYGLENFTFKIICICFDDDCDRFEQEYIEKFGTLVPNGYNLVRGGKRKYVKRNKGYKLSELTKERIGLSLRKYYKKFPDKKLKKIGENNPNYGKCMSTEQKLKIAETLKKIYKTRELNNKCKLSEKANNALELGRKLHICNNSKKIGKYDLNGKLIDIYSSISEAGRKNNMGHQHISKVCNNHPKYQTAGGFVWKFLLDDTIIS